MSVVLDGRDILSYHSYLAIAMSENLKALLKDEKAKIPKGVLFEAKNLFSMAVDYNRKENNLPLINKSCDIRKINTTYKLLTDMLKRSKKIGKENIDSELEKLAIAMESLSPDGKQIAIARESYELLQKVFETIHNEACNYPRYGGPSPYSYGNFDNSDD